MVDFVPLTQLTDTERTVYHAFALGRRCDLSTVEDKTVRAPVIAALLTDRYPPANPGMPGLHLAGAQTRQAAPSRTQRSRASLAPRR